MHAQTTCALFFHSHFLPSFLLFPRKAQVFTSVPPLLLFQLGSPQRFLAHLCSCLFHGSSEHNASYSQTRCLPPILLSLSYASQARIDLPPRFILASSLARFAGRSFLQVLGVFAPHHFSRRLLVLSFLSSVSR